MKFKAYQSDYSIELNFTNAKKENEILGTMLNETFRRVNLEKSIGAKGFKLSSPIHLEFTVNGKKFDTGNVDLSLATKLKLQNNAKGKKRFAQRFKAIFDYVSADVQIITFENLLSSLD